MIGSLTFLIACLGTSQAVVVFNANFGSGTITRWDTQAPFAPVTFISGLTNPVGVAVDTDGNVYVTQFGSNGTILKYNTSGNLLSSINNLGYLPYSVRFDSSGTLYVADINNSLIRRYTGSLSPLSNWATTEGGPTSIQFTLQGFVLVANATTGDNVQKFSTSGVSQQIIGDFPTLSEPHDAVTDAFGNIYVASRENNRVVKYGAAGNLLNASFISGFDPYSLLIKDSTLLLRPMTLEPSVVMMWLRGIFSVNLPWAACRLTWPSTRFPFLPSPNPAPGPRRPCSSAARFSCAGASAPKRPDFFRELSLITRAARRGCFFAAVPNRKLEPRLLLCHWSLPWKRSPN